MIRLARGRLTSVACPLGPRSSARSRPRARRTTKERLVTVRRVTVSLPRRTERLLPAEARLRVPKLILGTRAAACPARAPGQGLFLAIFPPTTWSAGTLRATMQPSPAEDSPEPAGRVVQAGRRVATSRTGRETAPLRRAPLLQVGTRAIRPASRAVSSPTRRERSRTPTRLLTIQRGVGQARFPAAPPMGTVASTAMTRPAASETWALRLRMATRAPARANPA